MSATHYTIDGLRIERVTPEPCLRLEQYGRGEPITCRCTRCAARNQTPEQARASVDAANGVYRLHGRRFAVVATFPDSEQGAAEANTYMTAHPNAAVLAAADGRIVLADVNDKGV